MVITIPEQFAGTVRCEPESAHLKSAVNAQLISIAKIVSPVYPAKLEPVAIRQKEAGTWTLVPRSLNNDAVFPPGLIALDRLQVFVSGGEHHQMFVLVIYVRLTSHDEVLHPITDDDAGIPLKVPVVLVSAKYLQTGLRAQVEAC